MLKLTGCVMLAAGCFLMGVIKSVSFKERRKEIDNVIEILKLIEIELIYKKDPLAKTLIKVSHLKKSWLSEVLRVCSKSLEYGCSLDDSWYKSKQSFESSCPLKHCDTEILDDFFLGLGKSDIEGHKRLFEPITMRLMRNRDDAYGDECKLGKMYKALGGAAGITAAVLIL